MECGAYSTGQLLPYALPAPRSMLHAFRLMHPPLSVFMKIAHIQGIFSPEHGGPAQSLTNYCRGQVAAGHRVEVWTLEGYPHTSPAIRLPPPVETHVFAVEPPSRLGGSARMRKALERAEPADVYHLHGAWLRAMQYAAAAALRRKRPYVLEIMGMYEPWALGQKWMQKRLVRWWFQDRILREAACLHVNSSQEAAYLRQLGFQNPIAVIPVGVDLIKLEMQQAEVNSQPPPSALRPPWPVKSAPLLHRAALRSQLPAPSSQLPAFASYAPSSAPSSPSDLAGRPFVLYLSRLHPKKGLDLLIRSWAKNRKSEIGNRKSDDWRLVIAGTGPQDYVNECRQLADRLGIASQCLWLGHVDEGQKSWLFTNAHCYVLPTSSENFGNTVAEALAHGTPVITTRHTPWSDLPKYACGWMVDNTEEELCPALEQALGLDAAARARMGDAGRPLVREKYSLPSVLNSVEAVYQWVAGSGSKPECVT